MSNEIFGDEFGDEHIQLGDELGRGDMLGDVEGDDAGDDAGDDSGSDSLEGEDVGLFRRKRTTQVRQRTHDPEKRQAYLRALAAERERGRREGLASIQASAQASARRDRSRRTFGGKTVQSHGYTKGRVQSVGFSFLQLGPGQISDITTRPQTLFRGTRLVIPSAIAPSVVIEDIKVGRNSQFAASGGQPGEAFKDTATGDNVSLDTSQPGMDVTLKVQNTGATAIDFRATLFGDVVE